MAETLTNSIPESKIRENTTPESFDVLLDAYKKSDEITKANDKICVKEREEFGYCFENFLKLPDYTFGDSSLFLDELRKSEQYFKPKDSLKLEEQVKSPNKSIEQSKGESGKTIEKQELLEYAKFANLSYATYEKINKDGETTLGNLRVKDVNLDFASIDFKKFKNVDENGKIDISKITDLNSDERFIISYINNHTVDTNDTNEKKENYIQFASLEDNSIKSDANKGLDLKLGDNSTEKQNEVLIEKALVKLKESKTSEFQKEFDAIKEKGDFKVLAFYPEEGSKDTGGFQCVLLEKDGKKILSIAGTNDIKDLFADLGIGFGLMPETQTKRMIDFFKKHLSGDENITVVGHSLGGNLSQIATSIYGDKIKEAYTFNSPGAKELDFSINESDPYQKELKDLKNNRKSDIIENKITNVKGIGYSPIAGKGVDIGKYRIDVNTTSHSIIDIIKAIESMDKIVRYDINDKKPRKYNQTDITNK